MDWQGTTEGTMFSPTQSNVNSQGMAETQATTGPLASGGQAIASACAWISICATFTAKGVDPADWRIEIISGAGQSVSAGDVLRPVILRVTDTAADPVAGALVEVHQTLDAWQGPCPDRGRCPLPPGESAQVSSAVSDINGLITIVPLQLAEAEGETNIVAATGTQGFVSLSLQKNP